MSDKKNKIKDMQLSVFSKLSHELRTPLHGIKSLSDFLYQNWQELDEEEKKNCIMHIAQSTDMLQHLLDSLETQVAISNKEITLTLAQENFIELIQESVDNSRSLFAESKITINTDFVDAICYSFIDRFWFKQLLINILSNAVKFSRQAKIEEIVIDIAVRKENNDFYIVSIADRAGGILEAEVTEIFQAYKVGARNTESTKSLGLGLAISKEIVEKHRGKIWAENNNNRGMTVFFTVPII